MRFDELTAEQQAIVRGFVTELRAAVGDLARALRLVGGLGVVWATYGGLIASLARDEELPSSSGLAGIGPVTVADVLATMQQLQTVASLQSEETTERMVRMAGFGAALS